MRRASSRAGLVMEAEVKSVSSIWPARTAPRASSTAGGGVVRRADDHYVPFFRRPEDILIDLQSSDNDYRVDFLLDGKFLDVSAVADDENRFLVVQVAQPALE